ncbi:MAG: hypothetical protein V2A34_10525, partial [Lentisphaerota bacterium]
DPVKMEGGASASGEILVSPYFKMERLLLQTPKAFFETGLSFVALFASAGDLRIQWQGKEEKLLFGQSCLIPSELREYQLTPLSGAAEVLRITAP